MAYLICPICGTKCPIESKSCPRCGVGFKLEGEVEGAKPMSDTPTPECGKCENFENFNCNEHNIRVYAWEKYPCKEFKPQQQGQAAVSKLGVKLTKIPHVPLHKRDLSKYNFKLPIITRFLIFLRKKKINPYILTLLIGCLLTALPFIGSILEPGNGEAYTLGILIAHSTLLFIPSLFFYYLIEAFLNFFDDLKEIFPNDIIEEKFKPLIKTAFSPIYIFFSIGFMGFFAFWISSPAAGFKIPSIYYITYITNWLLIGYMSGKLGWIMLTIFRLEFRIAKSDFRINHLNTDGYGGMKFLGDFVLLIAMSLTLVAFAVPISLEFVLTEDLPIIFRASSLMAIFIIPIIIGVAFFIPMLPLDRAAQKQKETLISSAIDNYRHALNDLYFDPDNFGKGTRVMAYKQIIDDVEKLVVWPLNSSRIVKLLSTMGFPILLALIKIFFPQIIQLIGIG